MHTRRTASMPKISPRSFSMPKVHEMCTASRMPARLASTSACEEECSRTSSRVGSTMPWDTSNMGRICEEWLAWWNTSSDCQDGKGQKNEDSQAHANRQGREREDQRGTPEKNCWTLSPRFFWNKSSSSPRMDSPWGVVVEPPASTAFFCSRDMGASPIKVNSSPVMRS